MPDPLGAQSDGRRPIIEALLAELISRRDDPLDRLEYLLRNCGYLAERTGDRVDLSDNAHHLDFQHLAGWLPFRAEALEAFPWANELARRGCEDARLGVGPERFLQRIHGYKVPALCLDGLVAYLVKALSAVGVITNWSCAGHVGFLAIGLDRGCSSAWTAILLRHAETRLGLTYRWEVLDGLLSVRRSADVDWVRYFLEVLDVADVMYRSRIRLREIRSRIVKQMDERAEEFAYDTILSKLDLLLRMYA
jgi:hypothetical protein